MRVIIVAAAAAALLAATVEPGYSQSYNRCAQLASKQGLSAKSASGRNFINRCMRQRQPPRASQNCPDDPFARSAFPSWACP